MDFAFDSTTADHLSRMTAFMDECVYPSEEVFEEQVRSRPEVWGPPPVLGTLTAEARARGLWNMFLPGKAGAGLTNLQYAPVAEISGRSPHIAPAATNCAAPDTGNMEVLHMFGTAEQKRTWLDPLLQGTIRSGFAMTEPAVASSDATNIETSITKDGDTYVVNGRKWWTTGAMNPEAAVLIVMGKTDPAAARHRQQSMLLVPRDTPGVRFLRGLDVLGYDDREHGGHAEIEFDNARVPASHLIGAEGDGFAIAQARLGPGRVHHCMRAVGMAQRALELMVDRASSRVAFGRPLADQGVIRDWIADSTVSLEQLRLLVLKTAWLMDERGNKAAHREIQAIKIATPAVVERIIDRAVQTHGAAGLSQDFPLARYLAHVRTLRLADGPDEVHKNALARSVIRARRG